MYHVLRTNVLYRPTIRSLGIAPAAKAPVNPLIMVAVKKKTRRDRSLKTVTIKV
jgi:hypothetical protein